MRSTGGSSALLNERAELAREVGRAKAAAGRRAIRDAEREREVLLRVTMANAGPMPQADLLALYRRLMAATRALEARDRAARAGAGSGGEGDRADDRPDLDAAAARRAGPRFAPAPTRVPAPRAIVANAHLASWGGRSARLGGRGLSCGIEDHDRRAAGGREYDGGRCSRTWRGSGSAAERRRSDCCRCQ